MTLQQPVPGVACGETVYVVDASVRGVRLSHSTLLSEREKCDIAFDWNGHPIAFVAQVRWTKLQRDSERNVYQSGCEIAAIDAGSSAALRSLIESCVDRALEEQKVNANGIPYAEGTPAQRARARMYERHELVHGVWRKMTTTDPRQPHTGFTVAAEESPHQVELLRAAYGVADGPMRQMIRKLAELSISNADRFPRRFTP